MWLVHTVVGICTLLLVIVLRTSFGGLIRSNWLLAVGVAESQVVALGSFCRPTMLAFDKGTLVFHSWESLLFLLCHTVSAGMLLITGVGSSPRSSGEGSEWCNYLHAGWAHQPCSPPSGGWILNIKGWKRRQRVGGMKPCSSLTVT